MSKDTHLKTGYRLYQQGKLTDALCAFEQALQTEYDNKSDIYQAIAVTHAQLNQNDQALHFIALALAEGESTPQLYHTQANLFMRQSDFAQAQQALEHALKLNPRYALAYDGLGRCHMAQDRLDNALTAFKRALTLEPHNTSIQFNLALLYQRRNEIDQAINALNQSVNHHPTDLRARRKLAELYAHNNDTAAAIEQLTLVVTTAPDDTESFFMLGQLYTLTKDTSSAIAALEQTLILESNHATANHHLGIAWLQSGDADKALNYFLRQVEYAALPETLYNIGIIYMHQNRHLDAIHYLTQSDTEDSENQLDARLNLAAIALKRQRISDAIYHYKTALALDPDSDEIHYILNALESNNTPSRAPSQYISHLFDHYAGHYDTHLEQHLKYNVPHQLADQFLQNRTDHHHALHVLDLGCGTGLAGEAFREIASSLTGVDLSPKMLDIAQKKSIYDRLLNADISALPDDIGMVDLIIAADVFSYFGDLTAIFSILIQHLDPGGYLCFSVESNTANPYDYSLQQTMRYTHRRQYIHKTLDHLGYNILDSRNAIIRQQNHKPVEGYLICAQRTTSTRDD